MVADAVNRRAELAPHFPIPNLVFENRTRLQAAQFDTVDQHGSAFHVVMAKAAYRLGPCGADGLAVLAPLRGAVLDAEDRYFDDDEDAGVRHESDFAPYKPACDVIVNATAWAPGPGPANGFDVRLTVRRSRDEASTLIDKTLHIGAARNFEKKAAAWRALQWVATCATFGLARPNPWRLGAAQATASLPLRYRYASGGQCLIEQEDANRHEASEDNPIGRGFARRWYLDAQRMTAYAAPQISAAGGPMSAAQFWRAMNGAPLPAPQGMGVVGRGWLPRRLLAGTFENRDSWDADDVPRLPPDFDFAWYNGAPRDQQCHYLGGGEFFTLVNLCGPQHGSACRDADGSVVLRFGLPPDRLFLMAVDGDNKLLFQRMVIDTVTVEPDAHSVELVWRALLATDIDLRVARLMQVAEPAQIARLDGLLEVQDALAQAASSPSPQPGQAQ